MGNKFFEGKEFAVQVIAKGSFADQPSEGGKTYLVETATVRLNHVALGEWQQAFVFPETALKPEKNGSSTKKQRAACARPSKQGWGRLWDLLPGREKKTSMWSRW